MHINMLAHNMSPYKLMLNVHTKMYAHNSQINADHGILNTGHERTVAKLILDVF